MDIGKLVDVTIDVTNEDQICYSCKLIVTVRDEEKGKVVMHRRSFFSFQSVATSTSFQKCIGRVVHGEMRRVVFLCRRVSSFRMLVLL